MRWGHCRSCPDAMLMVTLGNVITAAATDTTMIMGIVGYIWRDDEDDMRGDDTINGLGADDEGQFRRRSWWRWPCIFSHILVILSPPVRFSVKLLPQYFMHVLRPPPSGICSALITVTIMSTQSSKPPLLRQIKQATRPPRCCTSGASQWLAV